MKSDFKLYRLSSLRIPEQLEIKRHLHGRNTSLPTEIQQTLFDRRTIFYDVFYCPARDKIIGLGPKFFNLEKELLPMTIFHEHTPLNFSLSRLKSIFLLEIDPPQGVTGQNVTLQFRFSVFAAEVPVELSPDPHMRKSDTENRLTLVTLQKNNHVEWIEDWIRWYYRLHNVQRMIIYDNDSANRDKVVQRIKKLDVDMKIVFVDWPFEYGRSKDKFSQRGVLNHCRIRFPVANAYCINTDIDEYLVMKKDQKLLDFLDDTFNDESIGSIRMRESWIPRQLSQNPVKPELMRAWDHSYHRHDQGIQANGKTKYIFQFDRILYNSVHIAITQPGRSTESKFTWKEHVVYAISNSRFFLKKVIGLNTIVKTFFGVLYVPCTELFYYHFRGLRFQPTEADDPQVLEFDAQVHRHDPNIRRLCEQAGIIPPELTDSSAD